MLCPLCQQELKLVDRQGIEIDYCPKCRGVWLDRGELDKLIERASVRERDRDDDDDDDDDRPGYSGRPPAHSYPPPPAAEYDQRRESEARRDYEKREDYDPRRKRKSFFSDLFDFWD